MQLILLLITLVVQVFAATTTKIGLAVDGLKGDTPSGQSLVVSWDWGLSKSFLPGGGSSGPVQMSDITVKKAPNTITAGLLTYLANGKIIPSVTLTVYAKDGTTVVESYLMESVFVTGLSLDRSNTGDANEVVSFAFNKITATIASSAFTWTRSN